MSKERNSLGIGNDAATRDDAAHSPSDAAAFAAANACGNDARADFPIIVHCHLRWDFVWQRPQQIFSRLAKDHRILFIEDPVIADGEPRLAIDEPYPNLVRVIPQIPRSMAVDADLDAEIFLPQIRQALREHPLLAGKFVNAVQWFYSPMPAPGYMGQLGAVGVVYDCMDELANFRFAPPDIGDRERLVMANAGVVFTGGYQLFESKSKHHGNVHFYGCGVDVGHYGKARDTTTEIPAAVAATPGPRFGYFGVIDERLDYELIAALAERFPEASVIMAGPVVKVDPEELPKHSNIHWLGQQRYEDLPSIVKGFDVCLMPFALNEATRYINPTKTLEYMAAGKPIVSTAVADVVRNFTPIVSVAYSQDEFIDAVERAWRDPDAALLAQGIERAEGASWDATVESMRCDVQQALWADVSAQAAA
ncbi:glycosyltransferase [Cognatilysobacter lacus]|nr:glycosyltransferase [Lysobacter lacus]